MPESKPRESDVSVEQAFTPEELAKVNAIIEDYQSKPGSLIPALEDIQEAIGYLPKTIQRRVALGLRIPFSEVYGVVTFYSFFTMVPRGRHIIKVCLGTACYVRGGKENLNFLQRELGVEVKGTTEDLRFSLDSVRCVGACGMAPAIIVDDDTYAQVARKNIMEILDRYE